MSSDARPPAGGGPVEHHLYVLVGGPGGSAADQKSRGLTQAILEYVHGRIAVFAEMGVAVRVHKVRKADLEDARLVAAMKAKGITSLPALVTPNDTYVGNREIGGVYEKNIQEYAAWKRRGLEGPAGYAPEDDLASFYRSEMTVERAQEEDGGGDDEEGGLGEGGGDMMGAYRSMMSRREGRAGRSAEKGPPAAGGQRGGAPPPTAATPSPAAPRRPDNLGADEEDSLERLIDQMSGAVDTQTFNNAFSGGGGDSFEGEGDTGGGAQDDLMEHAYWANQEASL